jgi:ribose transport system substrate-binding protein
MKSRASRRSVRSRFAAVSLLTMCLAGSVAAMTLVGSVGTAAASQKPTIFVFDYFPHSLVAGTWGWYNGYEEAAAQLKGKFNVVVKDEASLDGDPGNFVNFIRTGMEQNPSGVVIVPNNGAGMASGLTHLMTQYPKVKFMAMDSPVPKWKGVSFDGSDNYKAGQEAASALLKQYHAHKLASTQIAVFKAPAGTESQDDRVAGFLATLKGTPLKVVDTIQSADSTNTTAETNMADVLTAHPQLGGVFSATDDFGLGVADELVKANKLNIYNVSIDADTAAVQDIISHKGMNTEIAQNFKGVGYTAVMTLAQAMEGKSVKKTIYVPTTIVTAANAKKYLKQASQADKAS